MSKLHASQLDSRGGRGAARPARAQAVRGRGRGVSTRPTPYTVPHTTTTNTATNRLVNLANPVPTFSTKGIEASISSTLKTLNLPNTHCPIKFINLPDVDFIGGRVAEFIENWKILTPCERFLNLAGGGELLLLTETPQITINYQ